MAVNRQMAQALILPHILLIHLDTHQVGHDICQAMVVIALHPYHFHLALGIGEFANVAEKFPVLFGKAAEIQIGENIAQQNQSAKTVPPQHAPGVIGAAYVRPEVQVGEDERVANGRTHHFNLYRANVKE